VAGDPLKPADPDRSRAVATVRKGCCNSPKGLLPPSGAAQPPGGRNLRRRGIPRRRRGPWASFRSSSARKRSAAAAEPGTGPDPEPSSADRTAAGDGADAEVDGGTADGGGARGATAGGGAVAEGAMASGAGRPALVGLEAGMASGGVGAELAAAAETHPKTAPCCRSRSNRSTPCWISTLAMLLRVRDSSSASRESLWQRSSGSTTWIRGDLGRPLEEV